MYAVSLASFCFSEMLMPTTSNLPACFCCNCVRCGIAAMQGPHQVAQKSTTYTLPFSNSARGVPFTHLPTTKGGGDLPMRSSRVSTAAGGACDAGTALADTEGCFEAGWAAPDLPGSDASQPATERAKEAKNAAAAMRDAVRRMGTEHSCKLVAPRDSGSQTPSIRVE
jgi:hypothetical protein